ncbi:hypothetical protein JYU34_001211 [Plutella xylostella]|uniref:Uncharacterized protein n=1 Tax=Plutella xylostella TaxID=51655 RepID=A0ABQ7R6A0_PLUXY|nr:hypothetical protein JYU34_001211 [Plutella xylostella]
MAKFAFFVLCAQALFIQSIYSQCIQQQSVYNGGCSGGLPSIPSIPISQPGCGISNIGYGNLGGLSNIGGLSNLGGLSNINGLSNLGGLSNIGYTSNAIVSNGYGSNANGGYGGSGYGEIVAIGDLGVGGQTLVNGNLPASGIATFNGAVPAGGYVTIIGSNPGICSCQCPGLY